MNFSDIAWMGRAVSLDIGSIYDETSLATNLELALKFDAGSPDLGLDSSGMGHHMTEVDSVIHNLSSGAQNESITMDDAIGGHLSLASGAASDSLRSIASGQTGFTIAFWIYVPTGTSLGGYIFDTDAVQIFIGTNDSGDMIPYFQINATAGGFTPLYPTSAPGVPVDTWTMVQCRCTYAHAGYGGNTVLESRVGSNSWEVLDVGSYDLPTDGGTPHDVFVLAYGNSRAGAGCSIDEFCFWKTPKNDARMDELLTPLYPPLF